jgi:MYXO-CTERM domain-containing protein
MRGNQLFAGKMVVSLLCGTLGATAGASVVGGMEFTFGDVYLDASAGDTLETFGPSSFIAGGSASIAGCSVGYTPVTAAGFTLSGASDGNAAWSVFKFEFRFTAMQNLSVTLSGDVDALSAMILFTNDASPSSPLLFRMPGAEEVWSSGVINLVAGQSYTLAINPGSALASTETGTILDFAVVPAPGAMALLGVAGLVGSRRRR